MWIIYRFFNLNTMGYHAAVPLVGVAFVSMVTLPLLGLKVEEGGLALRLLKYSRPKAPWTMLLALLVIAWTCTFLLEGVNLGALSLVASLPILSILVLPFLDRNGSITYLRTWAITLAVFFALFMILAAVLGMPDASLRPAPRRIPDLSGFGIQLVRVAGPLGGHALSGLTALLVIVVGFIFLRRTRIVVVALAGIVLLLSESRSSYIGLLVAVALVILMRPWKYPNNHLSGVKRVVIVIALFTAILVILATSPDMNGRLPSVAFGHKSTGEVSANSASVLERHLSWATPDSISLSWPTLIFLSLYWLVLGATLVVGLSRWRSQGRTLVMLIPMILVGSVDSVLRLGNSSILIPGWIAVLAVACSAAPNFVVNLRSPHDRSKTENSLEVL